MRTSLKKPTPDTTIGSSDEVLLWGTGGAASSRSASSEAGGSGAAAIVTNGDAHSTFVRRPLTTTLMQPASPDQCARCASRPGRSRSHEGLRSEKESETLGKLRERSSHGLCSHAPRCASAFHCTYTARTAAPEVLHDAGGSWVRPS